MSNKTTQIRIRAEDADYINGVAFKVTAALLRKVTAAEVLNCVIRILNEQGNRDIDDVSRQVSHYIEPASK